MENSHLSRRADSAKSSVEDVINDLIVEVEELEEKKTSLESKIEELESVISDKDEEITVAYIRGTPPRL